MFLLENVQDIVDDAPEGNVIILFCVQTSSIFFFHDFKQNAVAAAAAAPYQGQYAGYEAYPYSSAAAAAAAGK